MARRPAHHRAEPPISALVVTGLLAGTLLAAWWSVARLDSGETGGVGESGSVDDGWTDRGWNVDADRAWEGSVVRVTTRRCDDEIRGSGVVVDGAVLTNRHVVEGAASVVVTLADGSVVEARNLAVASDVDLARIDVPGLPEGVPLAREGPSSDGAPGSLRLVGFPSGHDLSSRAVAVDGSRRGWGSRDPEVPLHLDVEVVPGESGSAVIDRHGRVVGIVYARADDDGGGLVIGSPELRVESARLAPRSFERC